MCTKHWQDGDVHKYFSPYHTPYDAYINLMNVLTDFEYVLELHESQSEKEEMAAEVHD
jgi:alpha-amylase